MGTPRMGDGLNDTRAIITPLDNPECRAHLLDDIAIGQGITYRITGINPETSALAPPVASITLIVIPTGVTVDVTQVIFLCEVIDKNLLDSGVGVRMLGKQQYPSRITIEPMRRM